MAAGVFFLCVFFLVVIIQIVTRYMGVSVIWTEEVANYAFMWAVFMGAAVMVNSREHFNFDFIQRKLQGKRRFALGIFNDLVLIIFNVFIFILGIRSEERRVGKECRDRWWRYNGTEKRIREIEARVKKNSKEIVCTTER